LSHKSRESLSRKAAICGIGATEFSKESGRSELRLAVEAVASALAEAGIDPAEVGGLVTFSADTNPEIEIARSLGMGDLSFFSRIHYGGGAACATVQQAAMAVATGVADVVVCYRAFNERSGARFGAGVQGRAPVPTAENANFAWYAPYGLLTPATNPAAWFYEKPITLEDHQASRWIVDPLRLLDCCQETDGGQAIVVTSTERARDLAQAPVVIEAAAQGSGDQQDMMTSYYRDEMSGLPEMGVVASQLWEMSGIGPKDVQTAVLYDHFTPFVLCQLEELGFCGFGEAKDFVSDGGIELGGRLPINTHGGQLGEAYIHGMNGIAEGVRQVRGTSVNQVPDVEHVVVTAGTGDPTSGLVLGGAS
jgi:acetyl-CoA acetyltransferase